MEQWDMHGPIATCLGYYVAGAGSFNIARCDGGACMCDFFTDENCTTDMGSAVFPTHNDNNCETTGRMIYEPRSVKCYPLE